MTNEEKLRRALPECMITGSKEDNNYQSFLVSGKGFVCIALVSKTDQKTCYIHNYNGKLLKTIEI